MGRQVIGTLLQQSDAVPRNVKQMAGKPQGRKAGFLGAKELKVW